MRRKLLLQIVLLLILSAAGWAESLEWTRAHELYQRTDYHESLAVLLPLANRDAAVLQLMGQDYFMLGQYRKATEFLEQAVARDSSNAEGALWLGRANVWSPIGSSNAAALS